MKKAKTKTLQAYVFDEAAASRACEFFPRFLKHIKGPKAGKSFDLEPWQIEIVREVFGWKRPDGTRRYRIVYIEIPRKNGKSSFGAGLATYLLFADGEQGAEVYSAAGDRNQAAIVFDAAKKMVQNSPSLDKRADCYKRTIVYEAMSSSYTVLSSDAPLKHGLNPHGVIFDELHVQPNRELVDTLDTATGARAQPLTIYLTTAGFDKNTICGEIHDYALKVKNGIVKDESFLPVIFGADEDDDWMDPKTWKKANPNLGVSISMDYLREKCDKAKEIVAYENTFKRLHLNMWTQQSKRAISIRKWDACAGKVVEEELEGRHCYAGLDLANTMDVNALVYLFPMDDGSFKVLPRFFIPEESLNERSKKASDMFRLWVRLGHVKTTEGDVTDYDAISKQIEEDAQRFEIKEIAFDRWNATQLVQKIMGLGLTAVPIGQGFASMSAPTKEFFRLVLAKMLNHGGNPVLRWMVDNLMVRQDPAGNVKPDKEKSSQKIDGVVALIMALARAIATDPGRESVYDSDRGFLTI